MSRQVLTATRSIAVRESERKHICRGFSPTCNASDTMMIARFVADLLTLPPNQQTPSDLVRWTESGPNEQKFRFQHFRPNRGEYIIQVEAQKIEPSSATRSRFRQRAWMDARWKGGQSRGEARMTWEFLNEGMLRKALLGDTAFNEHATELLQRELDEFVASLGDDDIYFPASRQFVHWDEPNSTQLILRMAHEVGALLSREILVQGHWLDEAAKTSSRSPQRKSRSTRTPKQPATSGALPPVRSQPLSTITAEVAIVGMSVPFVPPSTTGAVSVQLIERHGGQPVRKAAIGGVKRLEDADADLEAVAAWTLSTYGDESEVSRAFQQLKAMGRELKRELEATDTFGSRIIGLDFQLEGASQVDFDASREIPVLDTTLGQLLASVGFKPDALSRFMLLNPSWRP